MAKNKTIVSEVATALGAAAARVENIKPKRATIAKHSKAKSVAPITVVAKESGPAPAAVAKEIQLSEPDEISLVAFLYAERRGFQGGSPHEDWLLAEQEVRRRRFKSTT